MTHGCAPVRAAADASAVSWRSSTSGRDTAVRSPRTPSAGFSSSPSPRKGNGLSEPPSRVRTTMRRPTIAGEHLRVGLDLLVERRLVGASEEEELGAEEPDAFCVHLRGGGGVGECSHVDEQLDVDAVPVCPGPLTILARLRRRCSRSRSAVVSAASGLTCTSPRSPSTTTSWPSVASRALRTATTAGMPRLRARIAVWLVGPPCSVTIASTSSASSVAVSAGARSRATSTCG